MISINNYVEFSPSKTEGCTGIVKVVIDTKKLTLYSSENDLKNIFFSKIINWDHPAWWQKHKAFLGLPAVKLIGERQFNGTGSASYFRFYTPSPITIFMPEQTSLEYADSYFFKIGLILRQGGFSTKDLA